MESFQSVCPILSDGFSDFSSYTGHNLAVKGLILMDESTQSMSSTFDQFITWDMKQTHMWRLDRVSGTTKAIKVVKFSEEKPNFIVSILYIAKMQLIIMSAEDLTFKLYDREMKFLESIRHQESAVFSMEYDSVSRKFYHYSIFIETCISDPNSSSHANNSS